MAVTCRGELLFPGVIAQAGAVAVRCDDAASAMRAIRVMLGVLGG